MNGLSDQPMLAPTARRRQWGGRCQSIGEILAVARSILYSRLLNLRTLVAAMVAVLVFQAAYVSPVAAASAPARAVGPVVPHAAPPAVETPVLDPAHEVVTARTETTRTYDLGNGRRAVGHSRTRSSTSRLEHPTGSRSSSASRRPTTARRRR
jgi:hypothetical protein